jgi:hypothetical protein
MQVLAKSLVESKTLAIPKSPKFILPDLKKIF